MLSKRAGVTVLVLFLTAAAIAAYMATSLLMPASAHPSPPPTVPEKPTGISASPGENGVTLQWDDPGDKSVTKYPIVRTMLQDGRPVLTPITVAENTAAGVEIGDPIAARDPDGSSLTYTLEGKDTDAFEVIKDTNNKAQLKTKDALNHEEKAEYDLTIKVRDGRKSATHALAVSVTATLSDEDERTSTSWQWARGSSQDGAFTDITGATGTSYTPQQANLGKYLRATVSYTDNPAGAGQQAMAATDNPVDEQITLDKESYTFHTFENSIADAPVIGNPLPEASNTNGTAVYSLSGGDSGKYKININDGRITVKGNAQLDYENSNTHSMTIEVTDDSGSKATAGVTINIKDLMEDDETKTLEIPGHGTITWTRIAETQFLMARNEGGVRKPEFELNAQLDPCFEEGELSLNSLHDRTRDWDIYDQYQLDMWWDDNTLKYRDSRRSEVWAEYDITEPDNSYTRGTNESCSAVYLDLWNDHDTLYALDTSHRLIKAHTLLANGTQYQRDYARDIPLSQDHYRSSNEIQGIWGDENHIWVNRAEQATNEDIHIAAYSRSTFLRHTTADVDLYTHATSSFNTISTLTS